MRALKSTAAALLALLLGAGAARADGSSGAEPFNFLFLDANARAVAMGGAYTALATDANALLYNPAGLARIERNEATFMHNSYPAGAYQEYGAYASPGGWSASFNYLNFGNVANTTISNPGGAGLGATGLYDMAFNGGYGRTFGEDLSLGAEAKYIRESAGAISGAGAAFDFGALYAAPRLPGLTLGAALQNAGPTVKYEGAAENLPLNLRGGAAYSFDAAGQRSVVSFDVGKERTSSPIVSAGAETVLVKALAIRLGFTTANSAGLGLTTGVGWSHNDLSFDYAFVPYGAIGNAQRVSVTWRWGSAKTTEPGAQSSDDWELKSFDAIFAESDRLVRRQRYDEAEKILEGASDVVVLYDQDPHVVGYYSRLARIELFRGNIAKAKALFTEIIRGAQAAESSLAVADAYLGLGQCLERQEDLSGAIRAYKKALEVGVPPESTELLQQHVKELEAAP
jgi:tetratricopeptide (TPR) repeat protein